MYFFYSKILLRTFCSHILWHIWHKVRILQLCFRAKVVERRACCAFHVPSARLGLSFISLSWPLGLFHRSLRLNELLSWKLRRHKGHKMEHLYYPDGASKRDCQNTVKFKPHLIAKNKPFPQFDKLRLNSGCFTFHFLLKWFDLHRLGVDSDSCLVILARSCQY